MNPKDIEALEIKLAEVNQEMRAKVDQVGTPEYRKLTLTSRALTQFLRGDQTEAGLKFVQSELQKIEAGTHPDSKP